MKILFYVFFCFNFVILFFSCIGLDLFKKNNITTSETENPATARARKNNYQGKSCLDMPLKFNVQCHCGKVEAAIKCLEEAPPLRLVCYCKDCRGYYSALNHLASNKSLPPAAKVDEWGGVDWMSIYPRDITITHGEDYLVTTKIRDSSPIRQVYASCCYTPMFRFGSQSVLTNTNLIVDNDAKPEVRFRIMGRQALQGESSKPKISWSIPFSWLWVMGKRINKDLMTPMPLDLKPLEEVDVLSDFKEE